MNILILGSGGREHCFAYKIRKSALCTNLYIAPGNAGTALCGKNLNIAVTDFEAIAKTCLQNEIKLILVGPEEPLVNGIYDFFNSNESTIHISVIGPSQAAAQLEGSKAFAKAFMMRHKIPTADYKEFDKNNYDEGITYLKNHPLPIVLKADGLAAGKGVLICDNNAQAIEEFHSMIHHSKFGEAGNKVVVEAFLKGIELSIFVLTDGKNYVLLPEAKDYKRIGEGDIGLNTGGMGAVSPLPFVTPQFLEKVKLQIIEPTILGLQKEYLTYKGFIFLGLMNDNGNPKVIEYNCRMGDPETETVLPRIQNDFVELLLATAQQKLNTIKIKTDPRAVATVVAVSGGYPIDYKNGKEIFGLNNFDEMVFHSGTLQHNNTIQTNGGRILAVTSYGNKISDAVENSVNKLKNISFEGMNFRKDIGYEFD